MKYLLDTHVCIWALSEPEKISKYVIDLLSDSQNQFYVSDMSLFEIVIKLKVGKLLEFNISYSEFVKAIYTSDFQLLPIKEEHFFTYNNFDFTELHKDPFDRYLISTAIFEKLIVISKDEKFDYYKVDN